MTSAVQRKFWRPLLDTIISLCEVQTNCLQKAIRGNNLRSTSGSPVAPLKGPRLGYEATEEAVYDNRYRKYVAT